MIVVSIDVGFHNLAIARIKFQDSSDEFQMLDWFLLDISVSKDVPLCSMQTKKCLPCPYKGKWIISNQDEDSKYMCTRHCRAHERKFGDTMVKNNSYMERITVSITNELDRYPQLLEADVVLVENQPVNKNPMAKTIQIILQTYFGLRGILMSSSRIKHVQPVHASIKMRACKDVEYDGKSKNKYSITKRKSVLACTKIVTEQKGCESFRKILADSRKKDDLADAFLQAWAYVMKSDLRK